MCVWEFMASEYCFSFFFLGNVKQKQFFIVESEIKGHKNKDADFMIKYRCITVSQENG